MTKAENKKHFYRKRPKNGFQGLYEYHSFKIDMPSPKIEGDYNSNILTIMNREAVENVADAVQKQVRKAWCLKHGSENIIIITPGSIKKKLSSLKYECEIHQLHMDDATILDFEKICKEEFGRFVF